jgi:hypothetical protein
MKAHILKYTFLGLIFCFAGGMGYFLGFRNAMNEVARNYSTGALMFFTGIHERLSSGEVESAKTIAAGGAGCQILAIDNIEHYPLILQFWSMFPYQGMPDTEAIKKRELDRAFAHFSKHPEALTPEAMTYLSGTNE